MSPNPLIAITGAGGFVGGHLRRHLAACGRDFRVIPRAELLADSEDRVAAALEGATQVYFLAGVAHEAAAGGDRALMDLVNVQAPLRWLRAADRAGVARFVWLSSIKVLGDRSDHPLAVADPYQPAGAYAHTKVEAEKRLLDTPLIRTRLTLVRPPLVYGPGVRANFRALLGLADSPWPLPLGSATAYRSMVSVDNLCSLLIRLGDGGEGIFHVADPDDFTVSSLVAEMRRLLRRPVRQIAVAPAMLRALLRPLGREGEYVRLFEPLQVNQEATRTSIGWSPPQPALEALEKTVTWFRMLR